MAATCFDLSVVKLYWAVVKIVYVGKPCVVIYVEE